MAEVENLYRTGSPEPEHEPEFDCEDMTDALLRVMRQRGITAKYKTLPKHIQNAIDTDVVTLLLEEGRELKGRRGRRPVWTVV